MRVSGLLKLAGRDVVRLRTNYRGEQVYLYKLNASAAQAEALLVDYVASINALVEQPQFYNALTDNCTTSIRRHATHINPNAPPFDWRMIVNGYGDELLYQRGNVDTRLPFEERLEARKNKPPFSPIGKLACGQQAVNHASPGSRLEGFRGFSGRFIGCKRPLSAPFCRLRECRPSGIVGLGVKRDGRGA